VEERGEGDENGGDGDDGESFTVGRGREIFMEMIRLGELRDKIGFNLLLGDKIRLICC